MSPRLPTLTAKQVLNALVKAGFYVHHQAGSHVTLKHPENPWLRITIPFHSRDLPRGTVLTIIKQAGMTPQEFQKFL